MTPRHTYWFSDCSGRGLTLLTMAGLYAVRQGPDGRITAAPPQGGTRPSPYVSPRRRAIAESVARRAFAEWCETLPAEVRARFERVAASPDPGAEVDALGASLGPADVASVETFDGREVVTTVAELRAR